MAHTILGKCTGCGECKAVCPVRAITGEAGEVHEINHLRCVDCSVCGMTCPIGCIVDNGGMPVRPLAPAERPKPIIGKRLCALCMLCVDLCRFGALYVRRPLLQGKMPTEIFFDGEKCVGCSLCARECPANAIEMRLV